MLLVLLHGVNGGVAFRTLPRDPKSGLVEEHSCETEGGDEEANSVF